MAVGPLPAALSHAVAGLCETYLRAPSGATGYPGPERTLVFEPPLTADEVLVYDRIVKIARSGLVLTPTELAALENDFVVLRTFRQQTQSQFMALTATQRDRALFDVVNAQTNVLRALLRD